MQDRITQLDEIFLHRTAGPYIGSKAEELSLRYLVRVTRYSRRLMMTRSRTQADSIATQVQ
jgi:hypothetical protein